MPHFRLFVGFAWKALRKCHERLLRSIYAPITHLILVLNGATCGSGLKYSGIMKVYVTRITIADHVLIGAHSTILKGVTIGEDFVVGAMTPRRYDFFG